MSILNFISRLNRIGFENLRSTLLPSLGGELRGGAGAEFSFVLDEMRIPPSRIFSSISFSAIVSFRTRKSRSETSQIKIVMKRYYSLQQGKN